MTEYNAIYNLKIFQTDLTTVASITETFEEERKIKEQFYRSFEKCGHLVY